AARRDAPHLGGMVVVAAVAEYAAAPGRRMGPPAVRRGPARRTAPRRSREHPAAGWTRRGRIRAPDRAADRRSAAGGPLPEILAGGTAAPATGGDDGLGSGGRAVAADRGRLRGLALGRSDLARPAADPRR